MPCGGAGLIQRTRGERARNARAGTGRPALEDGALAQRGFAFETLHGAAKGNALGRVGAWDQLKTDIQPLPCRGPFAQAGGDLVIRTVLADPLNERAGSERRKVGLGQMRDKRVIGNIAKELDTGCFQFFPPRELGRFGELDEVKAGHPLRRSLETECRWRGSFGSDGFVAQADGFGIREGTSVEERQDQGDETAQRPLREHAGR